MILYSPEGNPEVFVDDAAIPDGYCTEDEAKDKFTRDYHIHYLAIKDMLPTEALAYAHEQIAKTRYAKEQLSFIRINGMHFDLDRDSRNTLYAKFHLLSTTDKETASYKIGDKTVSLTLDEMRPIVMTAEALIDCLFDHEVELKAELETLNTAEYSHEKLASWLGANLGTFYNINQEYS